MKRALLLGALLAACAACLPATVEAHTTITCDPCSLPYQRWVDEAKMPTPDVTLTVVEDACDGAAADFAWACTSPGSYTIWDASPVERRETFLHEIGHNFDYYVLPTWARDRFERLTGDTRKWSSPPNSAREHFADAYARCAMTGARFRGDPNLLLRPHFGAISGKTYRAICRMINAVG